MANRQRLLVGAVGLAAFGLRCLYVFQSTDSPFFDFPQVDAKTYTDTAIRLADGQWQGDPEPFWQPPLYPYFLGLVFWISSPGYYLPRLIQAGLGALNCVLVYLLGRRIFSPSLGLAAAGLAAVYGPFLFFDAEFLPPALALFLDLLLLLSLPWAVAAGRYWRLLVPGLLLGLSALCVSNILLFVPFVLLWIFWQRSATISGHPLPLLPQRLLRPLLFLVGALLIIAPVSLRNYLVGHDYVLISSNAGINFYIGNNADYEKTVRIQPGPEWRALVARPGNEAGLTQPSQKSRFFLNQGLEFIRQHPGAYVRLLLDKLHLFWHGYEIGRNQDLYYARYFSSLLSLLLWESWIAFPFGLLAPLALVGIGLGWKRGIWRQPGPALLLLFLLSYALSVILFFVSARYRLPVVPVLLLFAVWGVRELYVLGQERRTRLLVGVGAAGAVLLVGANWRLGDVAMVGEATTQYQLGVVWQQKGLAANAMTAYQQALSLDPDLHEPRFNLGSLYARQGRYQRAIAEYRKFIEHFPEHPEARYSLGNVLLRIERYDEALTQYQRLLEEEDAEVDRADIQGLVAYTCIQLGRLEQANQVYRALLEERPDLLEPRYQSGLVYETREMSAQARREYREILRLDSTHTQARYRLALMLLLEGEAEEGKAHLRRLLLQEPASVQARWHLATRYVIEHRGSEALEQAEAILKIDPTHIKANWLAGHMTYLVKGDTLDGLAKLDLSSKYAIEAQAKEMAAALKEGFKNMMTR